MRAGACIGKGSTNGDMMNGVNGQIPVWSLRLSFLFLLYVLPIGLKCGGLQVARVCAIVCDCCYLCSLASAVENQVCLAECLRCCRGSSDG